MSVPGIWPVLARCSEWSAASEQDRDDVTAMAVGTLWALTGRVFGVNVARVRPCFQAPDRGTTYRGRGGTPMVGSWWPGLINGKFFSGSCACSDGCECAGPSRVALPGPIAGVESVVIDGVVLDESAYRVDARRWLVRVDGESWPQDQDMAAGDTEAGAFTVTYLRGIPVPRPGQLAAGDLACEFLRARAGGSCSIPERAQSISRQGVDIQLLDPTAYFDGGLTGVASVDQWIMVVNPGKARAPSRVSSPDLPSFGRFS